MTLRANFQHGYLWRYLAMGGIVFFMAIWFAFDGLIGYPREQQRSAAYEQLTNEVIDAKDLTAKWRELARSKGWSVDTPKEKAADFDSKIKGQYVFGGLCFVMSIPFIVNYFRSKNRWIEETQDGLITSWGQSFKFSEVIQLNKKRWADKGIARAYYKQAGADRCFVFDDFKYDRQPLGEMLRQLEAVLKPEQIVGGPPEPRTDSNSPVEES